MRRHYIFFALLWLILLIGTARRPYLPAVSPALESQLIFQEPSNGTTYPTLADFWHGRAQFVVDIATTGLPMGESETIIMANGDWWSYVHASYQSAGVHDQCGDPVPFPGCTVIYRSQDQGQTFALTDPICQFSCQKCPCNAHKDHTPQQQYPRVQYDGEFLWLVYEYLGHAILRRSADGLSWSHPAKVAYSGLWTNNNRCAPWEVIHPHPFSSFLTEYCLAGGPPGIYVEKEQVYIFVGMGQSAGSLGCFVGTRGDAPARYKPCRHNPLLTGAPTYGPLDETGPTTRPYWDFRMLSSAEVYQINEQYYMLYEGIRGPGPNDAGDTQFGLGLARTTAGRIDGPWETYPNNPLLTDLPGNIGLGHADLVIYEGETYLYTSLDGQTRSRLKLIWSK
ncbi:MAG: hypothetical protein KDE51_18685 [Anaerolineales bacterium]|nr:hypothetical protein [Anaerolineales bacterium]